MAGAHVRCSNNVHKKLKEIATREGVSLAHALELMVDRAESGDGSRLAPDLVETGGREEPSQMEGKSVTWEEFFPDYYAAAQTPANDGPESPPDGISVQSPPWQKWIEEDGPTMLEENLSARIGEGLEHLCHHIRAWLDERLESGHPHGGDANCQECMDITHQERHLAYQRGRQELLNLPGVNEAFQFYLWAKTRNEEAPNIPVVQSWADCPGVSEDIAQYGLSQGLVTINGGEDRVNDAQLTSNRLENAMRLALRSRDLKRTIDSARRELGHL